MEEYDVENKEIIEAEKIHGEAQPIEKRWYKDPMNIIMIIVGIVMLIWILIITL